MFRIFCGERGWYVAWEMGDGTHIRPQDITWMTEGEAADLARRSNEFWGIEK